MEYKYDLIEIIETLNYTVKKTVIKDLQHLNYYKKRIILILTYCQQGCYTENILKRCYL